MSVPVCVIVGTGPGNGAAFARQFSRAGCRVAMLARSRSGLDALEREIVGAEGFVYDATDAGAVSETFGRIRTELGPPSVLIYNASTRDFGDIDHTSAESFEHAWRVNTLGCLLAVEQVLPDMRRAAEGTIAIVGATASLKGAADFVAFASAKAAQRSLAQSLARSLGPEGIHVCYLIIDAVVDMPASRQMFPDKPDSFFARPDDIASTLYFLSRQPRSAWSFEVDLRPFGERW